MKNITLFLSALVALLFSVAETSAQITPPYYNPANVRITGGTINGTAVGATTAAAGSFTSLSSTKTSSDNLVVVDTTGSFKSGIGFYNNASGPYTKLYFDNATNETVFNHSYPNGSFLLQYNSNTIGTITSTGLAVTGALSASGLLTANGGSPGNPSLATQYQMSVGTDIVLNPSGYGVVVSGSRVVAIDTTALTLDTGVNLVTANDVIMGKTITAPATTGAQTINKTTGRVNFAAAATSLVVTNSLATANSICHVTKATNDATMRLGACVAAAGSITIYADVAPAAETAVNFTVTN